MYEAVQLEPGFRQVARVDDVRGSAPPVHPLGENVEQPDKHRVLVGGGEAAFIEERKQPLTEILKRQLRSCRGSDPSQ